MKSEINYQQWEEDINYLYEELKKIHPNLYHAKSKKNWTAAIEQLIESLSKKPITKIVLELFKLINFVRDGHTRIFPNIPQFRETTLALPFRGHVFPDGIYIIKTTPNYSELIGKKLLSINGKKVEKILGRIKPYIPYENEMGVLNLFPYFMVFPWILKALKIIENEDEPIQLTFASQETAIVEPKEYGELSWTTAEDKVGDTQLPIYRQKSENLSFHFLEENKIVYVVIRKIADNKRETYREFVERLFNEVNKNNTQRMIVDIRSNNGGNNYLNQPLLHHIIGHDKINQIGNLFIITGRETFSAAINLAVDLERETWALFAGEPFCGKINHFGDSKGIELPNSKILVRCSSLYWQNNDPRDNRPYIYPDIPVKISSKEYFGNQDPVLKAILNYQIPDEYVGLEANYNPNQKWFRENQHNKWETWIR